MAVLPVSRYAAINGNGLSRFLTEPAPWVTEVVGNSHATGTVTEYGYALAICHTVSNTHVGLENALANSMFVFRKLRCSLNDFLEPITGGVGKNSVIKAGFFMTIRVVPDLDILPDSPAA